MSAFIAFSVPAGLGLYWIATAVIQTIIQLIVNRYYDKLGTDKIVEKNIEKDSHSDRYFRKCESFFMGTCQKAAEEFWGHL